MKIDRYTLANVLLLATPPGVWAGAAVGLHELTDAKGEQMPWVFSGVLGFLAGVLALVGVAYVGEYVEAAAARARYVPPPHVQALLAALTDDALGWKTQLDGAEVRVEAATGGLVVRCARDPFKVEYVTVDHCSQFFDPHALRLLTAAVRPRVAAFLAAQKTADETAKVVAVLKSAAAARAAATPDPDKE